MAKEQPLTSRRPYLLRAMHEWMTDNGQTPHLVVDAAIEGVVVPRQYVRDGKIVLNVGYSATAGLVMKNDFVGFSARFGGVAFDVSLPIHAVLGIYARETGQGMIFSDDDPVPEASAGRSKPVMVDDAAPLPASASRPKPTGDDAPRRPKLKVIK